MQYARMRRVTHHPGVDAPSGKGVPNVTVAIYNADGLSATSDHECEMAGPRVN